MAKRTHRLADGEESRSTLGPSKTITIRVPLSLYKQVQRLARSIYQPDPVIFRAALQEYVQRHKPRKINLSGLSVRWPDGPPVSAPVTQPEPDLTPVPAPPSDD